MPKLLWTLSTNSVHLELIQYICNYRNHWRLMIII